MAHKFHSRRGPISILANNLYANMTAGMETLYQFKIHLLGINRKTFYNIKNEAESNARISSPHILAIFEVIKTIAFDILDKLLWGDLLFLPSLFFLAKTSLVSRFSRAS